MSPTFKTRVLSVSLLILTVWPALHIVLARQTGLSAWKLAGWGMYATPRLQGHGIEVYGRAAGDIDYRRLSTPSPALHQKGVEFLERYRWLSTWAKPGALAAAVFASAPQWSEIKINVFEPTLNATTGIIETRHVVYAYDAERGLLSIEVRPLPESASASETEDRSRRVQTLQSAVHGLRFCPRA